MSLSLWNGMGKEGRGESPCNKAGESESCIQGKSSPPPLVRNGFS